MDVPAPVFGNNGPTLADVQSAFLEIKKAFRQITFNRHDPSKFPSYLKTAFSLMETCLQHGDISLRIEVSTLSLGSESVLEDDARELNIVYPLWQMGIRLLTFRRGLSADELMRFYLVLLEVKAADESIDLLTALWREDLQFIEWVVVDEFTFEEHEDQDEVEVEMETILAYLKQSLTSTDAEGVAFARVSLEDLSLELANLQTLRKARFSGDIATSDERFFYQSHLGRDDDTLLEKICTILFQLMELPASDSEVEDLRDALEQVLDGLILQGKFSVIEQVIDTLDRFALRGDLPVENRELARRCHENIHTLMHEGHRIGAVATALNTGATRDIVGVCRYLRRLGPAALVAILDLMDSINNPAYRRAIANVLVDNGRQGVKLFSIRLQHASSQLAKELLYIIDKIDPPEKLDLFRSVLKHKNAVLRMEGLSAVARNQNETCFRIIADTFAEHDVPQMRAHAARLLGNYPPEQSAPILLSAATASDFDVRPKGERRAIFSALAKNQSAEITAFWQAVFAEKSGLLAKRRVDDHKEMAILAFATMPSIPSLQFLAHVAQDHKMHSKDICELAKENALKMRNQMLGGAS